MCGCILSSSHASLILQGIGKNWNLFPHTNTRNIVLLQFYSTVCVYRCVLSSPYIILVLQGIEKVRIIYFLIRVHIIFYYSSTPQCVCIGVSSLLHALFLFYKVSTRLE